MANSTLISDYLGQGTLASRPSVPPVASTVSAFYYATDTTTLFFYDFNASAWREATGATGSKATGISAAGTNQATATVLTANVNVVSTVAAGTGVTLPTLDQTFVTDDGANSLTVYPPSGGTINGGASVSVAVGVTGMFLLVATLTYRTVP